MKSEIILIGPIGTGKYYDEMGYDRDLARHHFVRESCWGIPRYWKPFEAYTVKRLLADHDNCVIDFGAETRFMKMTGCSRSSMRL